MTTEDATEPGRAPPGSDVALLQRLGALAIRMQQASVELKRGSDAAKIEGVTQTFKLYWAEELYRLRCALDHAAESLSP
jgi:hypothetical protein